jgi:hypothetical protein
MKLTFGEQQPIRLWFEYLKVCLNDKDLTKKVNRNFYKEWHLDLVKTTKFDKWLRTHEHLFTKEFESKISLFNGKKTQNTLLVEIPLDYTVQKIQRDIGKVVKVYDGDTCKVNLFLSPNSLKQFTIRMNGYDSPELKTKNTAMAIIAIIPPINNIFFAILFNKLYVPMVAI